jgi:hypothetical protein
MASLKIEPGKLNRKIIPPHSSPKTKLASRGQTLAQDASERRKDT